MRFALLIVLLAASAPGLGQADALPPWTVPVLRLVSETHVQPTTGIVLPGGERVLVPADFADAGAEIVVLDGGTDIVRHGRPARLEREFAQYGLKVLAVPGLQRGGAPLAPAMPTERTGVRLAAFPPAEQIAEGQPPVDWRGTLQPSPGAPAPALSGSERPNVTGPLLDDCDNLLGLSLAAGLPSLARSDGTTYRWRDDLQAIWSALDLPVTGRACSPASPESETPTIEEPAVPDPEPTGPAEPESTPDAEPAADPEGAAAEPTADAEPEPGLSAELPPELPPTEQAEAGTAEDLPPTAPPEPADRTALWGLLALLSVAAGLGVHALRRRLAKSESTPEAAPSEPESARGEEATSSTDAAVTPAGGVLVLTGRYADGRPLHYRATVNPAVIRLVLGRGGADIVLDSPAISRRHARLEGAAGSLTLSDLGSSNGTSVNGVPCLEGEVFCVETGDTIALADLRFTIEWLDGSGERVA